MDQALAAAGEEELPADEAAGDAALSGFDAEPGVEEADEDPDEPDESEAEPVDDDDEPPEADSELEALDRLSVR